jgi:hypothetical protein
MFPIIPLTVGSGGGPIKPNVGGPAQVIPFPMALGEIDELMDKVFTVGSINHKAYANGLHMPEAKEYLIKENEVAAWKQ